MPNLKYFSRNKLPFMPVLPRYKPEFLVYSNMLCLPNAPFLEFVFLEGF